MAAISQVHQSGGHANPTGSILVVEAMKGIARTHGCASTPKTAAVTDLVAAMGKPLGTDVRDSRDRALILLAGAMRRSELVAIDVGDVPETAEGLRIQVRRSKTDQHGKGDVIGVMYGGRPPHVPGALVAGLARRGWDRGRPGISPPRPPWPRNRAPAPTRPSVQGARGP